jgi:hypothetical protein
MKNDAQLNEVDSFDLIKQKHFKPACDRKKLEAETLVRNRIA